VSKHAKEVIDDSPMHLSRLMALQQKLAQSLFEYKKANENAKDAKKQAELDKRRIDDYLQELNEGNIFDNIGNE